MRVLLALSLLLAGQLVYAGACDVSDDQGQLLQLPHPAKRVISLAPDITEILFAIDAGKQVVGVIQGSDYPEVATSKPIVGSYQGLDLEKIVSLHPDLIVAWHHTFMRELTALQQLGIPVYITHPVNLIDVARTMRHLGCLLDKVSAANRASATFQQRLAVLYATYDSQTPVRVFYQIGAYSLLTINGDSWISQAIRACGGRNVFASAHSITPEVSWEAVVVANPQVIITDTTQPSWRERWQAWPRIAAVQQQMLFNINPDLLDRAGPRLVEGVAQLCTAIAKARGCA